jgi:hypothetical protein
MCVALKFPAERSIKICVVNDIYGHRARARGKHVLFIGLKFCRLKSC